jgi:hypothetical protein
MRRHATIQAAYTVLIAEALAYPTAPIPNGAAGCIE